MQDRVANTGRLEGPEAVLEEVEEPYGPPEASLKRRAQSYTDFHHAAQAVLDDRKVSQKEKAPTDALDLSLGQKQESDISSDIDFAKWYQHLEHELLESSHDDYTYAPAYTSRTRTSILPSLGATKGSSN